jgi:hypothetical protein
MKLPVLLFAGLITAIALVFTLSFDVVDVRADPKRTFIGSLTCTVAGREKFEFGRTRNLSCVFDLIGEGANQGYEGTISKYGLNIGAAEGKVVMVWSVFTADTESLRTALSGTYTGIVANGAIGGENGLIGGIENRFTLRPMRTQPNTDANFALAIAKIELRSIQPRAAFDLLHAVLE